MQRLTILVLSAVALASKSSGFVVNQQTMRVNMASAFLMSAVFGQGKHKYASAEDPEEKVVTVHFTNSLSRPVEVYFVNIEERNIHKVIPEIKAGESAKMFSHRGHLFDVYYPGDNLFDPVQSFQISAEDGTEEHLFVNFNEKEEEERRAKGVKMTVVNSVDFPLELLWIDPVTNEKRLASGAIESGQTEVLTTHPGHVFHLYPAGHHETHNPVKIFRITAKYGGEYHVQVDNPKEEDERRQAVGVEAVVVNKSDRALKIFWIDPKTEEKHLQIMKDIPPGEETMFKTHPGHTFHVYNSGEHDTHDPVKMFQISAGYGAQEFFHVEL